MQKAALITATSIKEGWGLIVTEAASQGTPAVVYDVDGLRDSVQDGVTGLATAQDPRALARAVVYLLEDSDLYSRMRESAWKWSYQITFNNAYKDFKKILEVA
jgi:glycosyltransferase involved in cell wall biosynthesis